MKNQLLRVLIACAGIACPVLLALTVDQVREAKESFSNQAEILNSPMKLAPEVRLAALKRMQTIIDELIDQRVAGAKGAVLKALNEFRFTPAADLGAGAEVGFSKKTTNPFQDIIDSLATAQKILLTFQKRAKFLADIKISDLRYEIVSLNRKQKKQDEVITLLRRRLHKFLDLTTTSETEKVTLKTKFDELQRKRTVLAEDLQKAQEQAHAAENAAEEAKIDAEARVSNLLGDIGKQLNDRNEKIAQLTAELDAAKKGATGAVGTSASPEADVTSAAKSRQSLAPLEMPSKGERVEGEEFFTPRESSPKSASARLPESSSRPTTPVSGPASAGAEEALFEGSHGDVAWQEFERKQAAISAGPETTAEVRS